MSNHTYRSGDLTLAAHLERPPESGRGLHGVVICHGFPAGEGGGANSAATFPELAARIARELGWVVIVPAPRGMPGSEGSFSLDGWLEDVIAAADHLLLGQQATSVWTAGFGTGGALAVCAAAADGRIGGAATIAGPADFSDWAANPRRLLLHARAAGVIDEGAYSTDFDRWASGLSGISAEHAAEALAPRPLLVVHGTDDDIVPSLDARAVAAAHGAGDLRMINRASHHLRHDPRAIAILLGWLDRRRRLMGSA
ncbi:MAG: alpha/beta hydrolase [Acidimicrobiales bacterium]|nr:alpha/beta hydrolase [Acidimicrobiales bacterium]